MEAGRAALVCAAMLLAAASNTAVVHGVVSVDISCGPQQYMDQGSNVCTDCPDESVGSSQQGKLFLASLCSKYPVCCAGPDYAGKHEPLNHNRTTQSPNVELNGPDNSIAWIVAAAILSVALIFFVIAIAVCCLSRRRNKSPKEDIENDGKPTQSGHLSRDGSDSPLTRAPHDSSSIAHYNASDTDGESLNRIYENADEPDSEISTLTRADERLPSDGRLDTAANRMVYVRGQRQGSQHTYAGAESLVDA